LLHQAFFVGFEGVDFFRLRGDQCVERREAIGDFLLLF
jgi:hypothetical protein